MKKQTALQEHIKWLYELIDIINAQQMNPDIIQAIEYVIEGAKAKLSMEKEQIKDAYHEGYSDAISYEQRAYMPEEYYIKTYHSGDANEMVNTNTP